MDTDILVTIAIPTYKRLHYLKEAVASALAQDYSAIEVLIAQDPVNNDLVEEIKVWCETQQKENAKVRYFFNNKNLGLAGNWNALAQNARGAYIIVIGDDDRLLPDCISGLMKGIKLGASVAFSNQYFIDPDGKRLPESTQINKDYHRDRLEEGLLQDAEKALWNNSVPMSSSLIETKWVQNLRFKDDLNTPELEFFLRVNELNLPFYFTPQYLSEYRLHPNSATSSGLRIHLLMRYLMPVKVRPQNYPLKKSFLESLAVVSVNNFLKEHQKKEAWKIFLSAYYGWKNHLHPKGMIQFALLIAPGFATDLLFGFRKRNSVKS